MQKYFLYRALCYNDIKDKEAKRFLVNEGVYLYKGNINRIKLTNIVS